MRHKSMYEYIWIGGSYQFIRGNSKQNAWYFGEDQIEGNLRRFFEFLEQNEMRVSLNALGNIRQLKARLDEIYDEDNPRLSQSDASELHERISELRLVILSEAKEVKAFFPNPKRYNLDFLENRIGEIFGATIFESLPNNARTDFTEAGRCIVFEVPTAAAYHLMRGSECVLEHLYCCCIKRKRLENNKRMWGPMVNHLEERGKLDAALKGTLDNFRKGFRNPIAHPDKFYSIDEAQDLLGTTTQLVSLLANHSEYSSPE